MESEIIVGSYDQLVLGYRLITISDVQQMEASFTDNSHTGCVKCMAVSQKGVLASGGTDETIRLLDVRRRKELGSLVQHNGTITCIEFHCGYMFSGSEDGCLCLWSTRNWECMRTFKGHKSAINSISVHPSGKLALSVGRDKTLRTWNLMTGKVAYVTNIKQEADIVKWSPDGDTYAIVVNNRIDIYCVETAAVKKSIQAEGRIHCLAFYKNDVIVYAGEGSQVTIRNVSDDDDNTGPLHVWNECDFTRIKDLRITPSPLEDKNHSKMIVVASSDGWVAAVNLKDEEGKLTMELACKYNSKFRLTCLSVYCKSVKPVDTENETAEETVNDLVDIDTDEDREKQSTGDLSSKTKKSSKKRKLTDSSKDEKEKHETGKKKLKQQIHARAVTEEASKKAKSKKMRKLQKKKKKSGMK